MAISHSPLCTGLDPGPSFIRRVNRLEYNNTVRDLLQTTLTPGRSFPPEERRLGFDDNGAALSVSPVLAEQLMLASEQLAADAVDNHWTALVPCTQTADRRRRAAGASFIAAFGRRAYRRPLDADDTAILKAVFDAGKATDLKTGIRLVITTVLQSPDFLYRVEFGRQPVAQRPKVAVKDTIDRRDGGPDAGRRASTTGRWRPGCLTCCGAACPTTRCSPRPRPGSCRPTRTWPTQAQRMLADPRARAAVADFHDQWLRSPRSTPSRRTPPVPRLDREHPRR